MVYLLMHENSKVAVFEVDSEYNLLRADAGNDDRIKSKLPVGVIDKASLKRWIASRGVPATRKGLKNELRNMEMNSPFEFMLANNGLSLTDHYWMKRIDDGITWEEINLYTNSFNAAFTLEMDCDKSGNIQSIYGKTNFTPSASLKGDLKKKWIIDSKGVRRLLKGNDNDGCRQSLCEVFATEMHSLQNKFRYTPYSLIKISSEGRPIIGCECPCFTDIDTEFISAIDIISAYKKKNSISYYEWFIQICLEKGIDVRDFMEYQIMSDFAITNQDRHLNNFGIIRNSKTLEWIGMAPIFDSGNSMFYKSSYIPVDKALLKIQITSFRNTEIDMLKYIRNRKIFDVSLVPGEEWLMELLSKDKTCSEETNERIVRAYSRKLEYLRSFQDGDDIWAYGYSGKQ